MANLQGRPSRSLQGMRAFLQGWGGGVNIFFATSDSVSVFSVKKGAINSSVPSDFSSYMSYGSGNGQSVLPRGIKYYKRKIYLCDTEWDRIQVLSDNLDFLFSFGGTGSGDGQFNRPWGISILNDNIYVGDIVLDRVQVFDLDGNFISELCGPGTSAGEIDGYTGVYAYGDYIYVSENGTISGTGILSVNIFDLDGNFVSKFSGVFTENTATVLDGKLVLGRYFSDIIYRYELDGTFIDTFSDNGTGFGQIQYITSVDAYKNELFVMDWLNEKITVFDPDFNPIREIEIDAPYSSAILPHNLTIG